MGRLLQLTQAATSFKMHHDILKTTACLSGWWLVGSLEASLALRSDLSLDCAYNDTSVRCTKPRGRNTKECIEDAHEVTNDACELMDGDWWWWRRSGSLKTQFCTYQCRAKWHYRPKITTSLIDLSLAQQICHKFYQRMWFLC